MGQIPEDVSHGATPGPILLFGSGETAPGSRAIWARLFACFDRFLRVAVLETPAGFQPNSAQVAGRVVAYLERRFPQEVAEVVVVPARQRGTPYSPDDPATVQPLADADVIYAGAGSPTYMVRQLRDSLAWRVVLAAHLRGTALVFASAAAIAVGTLALPVYEIYKVGMDLHWQSGLDLPGVYAAQLVIVPHWNNREGGAELDTSHCFMGRARFEALRALLPPEAPILGIDEHTAVLWTPEDNTAGVVGKGGAVVVQGAVSTYYPRATAIPFGLLGWTLPDRSPPWPDDVRPTPVQPEAPPEPPPEVLALVQARAEARARKDWPTADRLREEIAAHGWRVVDTPEGPRLEPLPRKEDVR